MKFDEAWALIEATGTQSIMSPEERRVLWDLVSMAYQKQFHFRDAGVGDGMNRVIEVGSAYGGTTAILALAGGCVTSVDNWQCGQLHIWKETMRALGLSSVVSSVIGDSVASSSLFPDGEYALVLVDADHDGDAPYRDCIAYAPKVAVGGYFCVDDCNLGHPCVKDGVAKWLSSTDGDFTMVVHCRGDDPMEKLIVFRRES